MILALLAGTKTQTRRAIKVPAWFKGHLIHGSAGRGPYDVLSDHEGGEQMVCPYGFPGERLWVKETFARVHPGMLQSLDPDPDSPEWQTVYRADANGGYVGAMTDRSGWKPSIFMPRALSRITLEIVSVRVERLKSISHLDCIAEGLPDGTHRQRAYWDLWDSINGKGASDLDPWVWVVEFCRLTPG